MVGRDTPERRAPRNAVTAQFSVAWAVAVALAYGEVTPNQLAREVPPTPALAAGIGRITCVADSTAGSRDIGGCVLRAFGPFGVREVRYDNAKGHPDHPLSDAELLDKFKANLRFAGVADAAAGELAAGILNIDAVDDVRLLADAIAGSLALMPMNMTAGDE